MIPQFRAIITVYEVGQEESYWDESYYATSVPVPGVGETIYCDGITGSAVVVSRHFEYGEYHCEVSLYVTRQE